MAEQEALTDEQISMKADQRRCDYAKELAEADYLQSCPIGGNFVNELPGSVGVGVGPFSVDVPAG